MRLFALGLAFGLIGTAAQAVCGPDLDATCDVPNGTYHIELPENADGAPALMFLHGWGSSGQGSLSMRGMVETALARGYAVIAPDGVPREGQNGRTWNFHPLRTPTRDEPAFLMEVRDDAAARFGIDAENVLLAGFSIGGSMTAYAACAAPDGFAGFAPLSGNFWRPHPVVEDCAGPVRMLHVHGWTDGTVPLEGRILRGDREGVDPDDPYYLVQGDIWHSMQLWRMINGCTHNGREVAQTETYWLRSWSDCTDDAELSMALFYGGHGVPPGWADLVLDWFEDPSG